VDKWLGREGETTRDCIIIDGSLSANAGGFKYFAALFKTRYGMEFGNAALNKLIIHKVGNKLLEDGVTLSNEQIDLKNQEDLSKVLSTFFLSQFKEPVYYNFHHVSSLELNEIYSIANDLFESTRGFNKKSKDVANILYEYSNHPKIKSGELYVAYFDECQIGSEVTDAIGIFKSENKETFLKVFQEDENYRVNHDEGISTKKLDKGCVIFNIDADEGFKVLVVDNTSNGSEAQYWKDEFLKLKPVADNYYQTKNYLNLTKDYVTGRLDEDFEISKADQIDYLNRSIDYFKKNEQFNEQEFASAVFEHSDVIKSFKKYKHDFQDEHDLHIVSEFEISTPAVKKQSKVFKSVLKLDRNFHVYIHGDRDLIEKGVDEDGRKYYKLYYREES
jgi:hypothetical protein